jgi:hypothetical protein
MLRERARDESGRLCARHRQAGAIWVLSATLLFACGERSVDPPSQPEPAILGSGEEPPPPGNADELRRVRVHLYFPPDSLPHDDLGGWLVEARRLPEPPSDEPWLDELPIETSASANVDGVAVLWLQHPPPYDLAAETRTGPGNPWCWWSGSADWAVEGSEVEIVMGAGCT